MSFQGRLSLRINGNLPAR